MNEQENETKLVSSLKSLGGVFVILAFIVLILRIIIDAIYGGSHFEKTNDILIIIGLLMHLAANIIEKHFKMAIFTFIFLIIITCSFFDI